MSAHDPVLLDMEQMKSIRLSRIALVAISLVGYINVGKPARQCHLPERFHASKSMFPNSFVSRPLIVCS
jgi:hypothetical protein